jgi:DNA-directed RNA polymerase subunit E"
MVVRKKQGNVCRECHRVVEGESCAVCGSSSLSTDWAGYLIIIDPKNSEIAKKMNIALPGKYALKVR